MRKGPLEDDLQYIAKYPLQYEQLKETTVLVTGGNWAYRSFNSKSTYSSRRYSYYCISEKY